MTASVCLLLSLLLRQDTVVVRADNAPVWGSRVRITRELRIGEVEGAAEYTFGQISSVTVGPNGSIFVVDIQVPTVREYDANGKYVRSFGRKGEGPGELQRPEAAVVLGNQLVVRDIRNRRFVVYPLNGGEPRHWPYQSSSSSFRPIVAHADGAVSTPFAVPGENARFFPAVLRYSANGTVRDTVRVPAFGEEAAMLVITSGRPGGPQGVAGYSIPYLSNPVWVYTSKHRFVGGAPTRYSLVVTDGRSPRRIDRTARAVPVSQQEQRDLTESLERTIRSGNNPNFKWNGPRVPAVKPYYQSLMVDSDDRIWVQLHGPSTRTAPAKAGGPPKYREPVVYDVISMAGRYLGQVRFPDTFTLHYVQGNQVWGTERDEFDVSYVVRYRIST